MNRLSVSISGQMAAVLIVALDFGAVRVLMLGANRDPVIADLLGFGALPMANVLVFGLIPFLRRPPGPAAGRPGLAGFEVFGGAALLLFLGGTWLAPVAIHHGVGAAIDLTGLQRSPAFAAACSALMLAPQLALARVGLRLGRARASRAELVARGESPPDCRLPGGEMSLE